MAGFICEERLTFGSWQAMERMLARLMEHSGFKDTLIVGGAGDHGADIVGTIRNQRWVIQAKYRQNGGVDSSAGREVVRALSTYNAEVAVAAINQYFTNDAFEFLSTSKLNGIDLRYWDGAYLLDYFRHLPNLSRAYRELRNYQIDAVDCVEHRRSNGFNKALIIMATGLGKSIVANQLIVNELERNPYQEVLVLAHMTDLVKQLEESSWSQLKKEYSTHLWTDGEVPSYKGGIVFATWQSISSATEKASLEKRFGMIIIDEAHHAPSNKFTKLIDDLKPNFLIGLTATPWRGDERNLSDIFGPITYSMDIIDGLQKGYLAEVDYRMLTDGINWDEIALMSQKGLTIKDLNSRLILPERDMAIIAKFIDHFKSLEKPLALIFCRSISHAERLRDLLSLHGIIVAVIHSGLSREQRFFNFTSFRSGLIKCLISVEMLNEGIDVPDVNLVAFMRVTHSRRIFVQQLGRGLRIRPGKSKVLILDFVADIRRIAAGIQMNRDASGRSGNPEVIKFHDGRIIKFENDFPASFFDEYLADVANVEDMAEQAKLKFPD